jgi:hypothetical protein
MEEGQLKKRIKDAKYIHWESEGEIDTEYEVKDEKAISKEFIIRLLDEAKKEFWECCTGYTNLMQNEIQFVKRTYQFNEDALANWALKWFGEVKKSE